LMRSHIKPGGWIELHELDYVCHCDDGTQPETYKFAELMKYVREALYVMGVDFFGATKLSGYMRDAGFVNVTQRVLKLPIGGWAQNPLLRKAGEYYQAVVLDGLQGIAMRPITKLLNWSPESVEAYLPEVRKDIKDPSIHSYMKVYVVYAQKPVVPTAGGEH